MIRQLPTEPTKSIITKLEANTFYEFRLSAVTNAGAGIEASITAKTKEFGKISFEYICNI